VNLDSILTELKRERDRLSRAIAALEDSNSRAPISRKAVDHVANNSNQQKRRGLTPAGRRRLSLLMKKRWAERRKKMS